MGKAIVRNILLYKLTASQINLFVSYIFSSEIFDRHLWSDQGRDFTGAKFVEFCSNLKRHLHLIATGASRANSQVGRVMSALKNLLTAVETRSRSWHDALGDVQLAVNCTVNRRTQCIPLELIYLVNW